MDSLKKTWLGKNLPWFGRWSILLGISAGGFFTYNLLQNLSAPNFWDISGLFTLGVLGTWRWSWWIIQVIRSRIYLHWVFPRWRRRANSIPVEDLPPVYFLVPTYKEKPWITERVFLAIAKEAKTLAHPVTILVTSGSDAENELILEIVRSVDPQLKHVRLIFMVQTGEGKRKAMADGLRELARHNPPADSVVALMDGDSELTAGSLLGCLPFFRLFPNIGALTTDELPRVEGSYLFSEWFHLRLSQRHYQMCSVGLSRKVLCLTGRFSLFSSEIALAPTFIDQLENDTLDDWLWGKFKFLSGDDKSTWFWLLQRGYQMLYIPDVIVYSIETISGDLLTRAYQNMRRWYGNMLRNSDRAIAIGPQKTGWFVWYCLVDQRISFWTTLITPGSLLIGLGQGNWLLVGLIGAWILFSRPIILAIIFTGRQSLLKPIHLPIFLLAQWSSCLVKIWTQMNLAQQKWYNRGNQSISAAGSGWVRTVKFGISRFLYYVQLFGFTVILLWLAGTLNPVRDLSDSWWMSRAVVAPTPVRIINAQDYDIIPSDGQDDSMKLQTLLDSLSGDEKVQINLPIGEIDLLQPLKIHRSHLILAGKGWRRTILQTHFAGEATLQVEPPASFPPTTVEDVELRGFAIESATAELSSVDGISLRNVSGAKLESLNLESLIGQPLILYQTKDVTIEYVSFIESPATE